MRCRSEDKNTLRSSTALEAQHLLAMLFCSYPTSRALFTTLNSLCIMDAAVGTEVLGLRLSSCTSLKLKKLRANLGSVSPLSFFPWELRVQGQILLPITQIWLQSKSVWCNTEQYLTDSILNSLSMGN